MNYDFEFRDEENDIYTSEQYRTKKEALAEIKRLFKEEDIIEITESWIYDDNNNFKGRWY